MEAEDLQTERRRRFRGARRAVVKLGTSVVSGAAGRGRTRGTWSSSGDRAAQWGAVGVSSNIVEASWRALVDAVEYKFWNDGAAPPSAAFVVSEPRKSLTCVSPEGD